MLFN
jgi:hypothetical protein